MAEHPFPHLKIDSTDFLDTLTGRSKCPKCDKSRKYYCYTCYVPVSEIKESVPKVKLPIKVDIIKHPCEVDGKSTAVHAKVIANDDVTIYTYPCIPEYEQGDKVLLVFPGKDSVTLNHLARLWLPREQDGANPGDSDKEPASGVSKQQKVSEDKNPSESSAEESSKVESQDLVESCNNVNNELLTQNQASRVGTESVIVGVKRDASDQIFKDEELGCSGAKKQVIDTHLSLVATLAGHSENDQTDIENVNKLPSECGNCEQSNSDEETISVTCVSLNDSQNASDACGSNGYPSSCESASAIHQNNDSSTTSTSQLLPGCPIERVVFIDSTWNQTKNICTDERLKGLRCVELQLQKSKFWRHQKDIPDTYLSTIEAIYYLLRDFHDNFVTTPYVGEYDNLLFFFTFMYKKICGLYQGGAQLKAHIQRKEEKLGKKGKKKQENTDKNGI